MKNGKQQLIIIIFAGSSNQNKRGGMNFLSFLPQKFFTSNGIDVQCNYIRTIYVHKG